MLFIFITAILLIITFVKCDDKWMFQSEKKWDAEWGSGTWDYMEKVAVERSKNAIIGSVLIQMYATKYTSDTNTTILDVGCGEGAISDFINAYQKANYVGVDVSREAVAIAKTKRKSSSGLKFVHSSVYDFEPKHHFDVIVFSDVLYYVDHEKIIKQYIAYLNPNGIMIISIFSNAMNQLMYENIFNTARSNMNKLDELDIGGYTKKSALGALEKTAFHLEIYRKKE